MLTPADPSVTVYCRQTVLLLSAFWLCWRCWHYIVLNVHRNAAAAERRMAQLQMYTLGPDDISSNFDATRSTEAHHVDVDVQERRKHGYADPRRLPHGGCLIHPTANGGTTTCVLYLPGYGRCFDHYDVNAKLRQRCGVSLCGLDVRKYGRSFEELSRRPEYAALPRSCYFNLVESPREGLTEYFDDVDDALVALQSLGYERVILWGNSTGGLAVTSYVTTACSTSCREGSSAARCGPGGVVVGCVLDAPLLAFCRGKLPWPSALDTLAALVLSALPAYVLQESTRRRNPSPSPRMHSGHARWTWLSTIASPYALRRSTVTTVTTVTRYAGRHRGR